MPVLKHDELAQSMTYSLEKELFEHSFAFQNECSNVVFPHLFYALMCFQVHTARKVRFSLDHGVISSSPVHGLCCLTNSVFHVTPHLPSPPLPDVQPDHQPADPDGKVKVCMCTCVRLYHAASAHYSRGRAPNL